MRMQGRPGNAKLFKGTSGTKVPVSPSLPAQSAYFLLPSLSREKMKIFNSCHLLLIEVSEQRLQALRRKAPAIRSKDVTYRVCRLIFL